MAAVVLMVVAAVVEKAEAVADTPAVQLIILQVLIRLLLVLVVGRVRMELHQFLAQT